MNVLSAPPIYNTRGTVYAVGFEVPADTMLEICWRLNMRLMTEGWLDEPDPFLRRAGMEILAADAKTIHAPCAAYLSQRANLPLRIVTEEAHIDDLDVIKWYVCHVFRRLDSPKPLRDIRYTANCGKPDVDNDHAGIERVRLFLGCQSPIEEYIFPSA